MDSIRDFLENGSKDFANIGNLDRTNDTVPNASGHVFLKIQDLELWIDSG